ncbi:hypothetical protein CDO35_15325 [Pseudomonas sediminis]|uniref:DUF2798 domain-containing protein n=1 Tax=Pseudomonas sediminis TaxID=1691904 RepID=A0A2G5FIL0_9PSED|nr:hypothetical protein CDO35_15325 [Pseudomonas sediminis]
MATERCTGGDAQLPAWLVLQVGDRGAGYLQAVLSAYSLAMPVAFVCVMLVRPIVLKLVSLTVRLP